MPVRKVVTEKHRRAASMLLDGESAFKALTHAGYSHYTARNFGKILRESWGLREALRQEEERRQHRLTPRPKRKKKYDRRKVSLDVRTYCVPEDRHAITNRPTDYLYAQELNVSRIASGLAPKDVNPRPAFENMTNCPTCGTRVPQSKIFLNYAQTGYVCSRCG